MSRPLDDALLQELDALLDGALPDHEAADLRQRIESDPALAAEYERRRRIVELVRALPAEAAPAGFSDALMERLPAKPSAAAPRRGVLRSMWMWGAGVAAAAALVIAVSLDRDEPAPGQDWTLAKQDAEDAPAGKRFKELKDVDRLEEGSALDETGEKFAQTEDSDSMGADSTDNLRKTAPQPLAPRSEGKAEALDPKSGTIAELDEEDAGDSPGAAMPGAATTAEPARSRDRAARRGTAVALLQVVERRQTALTAAERRLYLDQVARVDDAALRAHVDRVVVMAADRKPPESARSGESPRGATKAKAAKGPAAPSSPADADQARSRTNAAEFDVAVAKRADAEALRKLLTRAFPPSREMAKKSSEPSALVSRSEVAAESEENARGQLRLEWTVSSQDAEAMAIWLRRIGLRNLVDARIRTPQTVRRADEAKERQGTGRTAQGAEAESREVATATFGGAQTGRAIPVRVRIRFGPQSSTPERPKGEDK